MIKLKIGNICEASGCSQSVIKACQVSLTIPNPNYHRLLKIAGPYAAQRDFKYYKIPKNTVGEIRFPRGFASRFITYCNKVGEELEVEYDLVEATTRAYETWKPVELREYQEPIVKAAIEAREGVIYAGTGTGKTVCACEITRLNGRRTLILCPTTIIAEQFLAEFKKWFGYEPGMIGNGKKIIKDVTIAMWQSMSDEVIEEVVDKTGLVIIDECHGVISDGRSKILKKLKPAKLLGLSGSPRRSKEDGRTDAIFFYLGPIVAEYKMPMVTPTVEVINTRENIKVSIDYHEMVDNMVKNASRNTLITSLAIGEALSGHKVLILCKRREHCSILMEKFTGLNAYYADSDDKERNDVLMEMRSGERDFAILVGTVNILAAGTDIPSLDTLIIAGDIKSDVLLQQGSGRVLRLFEGKDTAKIYDLADMSNGVFKNQAYERIKFYKSQGWSLSLPWEKK